MNFSDVNYVCTTDAADEGAVAGASSDVDVLKQRLQVLERKHIKLAQVHAYKSVANKNTSMHCNSSVIIRKNSTFELIQYDVIHGRRWECAEQTDAWARHQVSRPLIVPVPTYATDTATDIDAICQHPSKAEPVTSLCVQKHVSASKVIVFCFCTFLLGCFVVIRMTWTSSTSGIDSISFYKQGRI